MPAGETKIRETQDWDGWWIVGAVRDGQTMRIELDPDTSPTLRNLAGRLCAAHLDHAATA